MKMRVESKRFQAISWVSSSDFALGFTRRLVECRCNRKADPWVAWCGSPIRSWKGERGRHSGRGYRCWELEQPLV